MAKPGWLAVLAVAAGLLLAGCGSPSTQGTTTASPSPTPSTSTSPGAPQPVEFDGEAALGFVRAFALRDDGSPRFRIPGSDGQREGASYLWNATALPGWQRTWQNFTGADYLALDRSPVQGYGRGFLDCSLTEEDVPPLPFHNLLAVRRSGQPGARLVVVAAHWDSQMHSDFDEDPQKRCLPDPGANDGASGVGVLLHLMRELDGVALPFDVGVLFLDGEDGFFDAYPLAGSLYFAQNPPVRVDRLILLDMVGDPGARYVRETASLRSDRALVDLLWRHGAAQGGAVHFTIRETRVADDHVAFIAEGVPAVDVIDAGRDNRYGFPPQWDTTEDTVDKLSAAMLGLVGRTLLATLQDPDFVSSWPAGVAQPR